MFLQCSEILNGVITEDKVHRNMRRLGGGRMELWRALTIHLKGIVASGGAKAEELSRIFTAALVLHVSRGDEQHRAERKIRTLIQLEVMPKTPEPSDSIADSSFSISMNETKPLGDISVSDNIAPPPVIVTSEPAKRLSSPRSSVSTAAKVSTPTQDPIVRKKALEALGGVDDSYDPPMDTAVQQNNLPMQRYNSTLTESGAASLPVLSGATDTTRSSNLMGRHSLEVVSSSSGVKPEKATSDVNTSMTSSVPQASKFSSTSNQAPKGAPVAKKWSNVNNMMSIEVNIIKLSFSHFCNSFRIFRLFIG